MFAIQKDRIGFSLTFFVIDLHCFNVLIDPRNLCPSADNCFL